MENISISHSRKFLENHSSCILNRLPLKGPSDFYSKYGTSLCRRICFLWSKYDLRSRFISWREVSNNSMLIRHLEHIALQFFVRSTKIRLIDSLKLLVKRKYLVKFSVKINSGILLKVSFAHWTHTMLFKRKHEQFLLTFVTAQDFKSLKHHFLFWLKVKHWRNELKCSGLILQLKFHMNSLRRSFILWKKYFNFSVFYRNQEYLASELEKILLYRRSIVIWMDLV